MPPLTSEIINGNIDKAVSSKVYDDFIVKLLNELTSNPNFDPNIEFDPSKHIIFNSETDFDKYKVTTLSDISIEHDEAISNCAFTPAFPLFSEEAIDIMRYELFQEKVFKQYGRAANLTRFKGLDVQIGGYTHLTPFTAKALTHEKTMEVLNKYAGLELQVMMPFELGSINFGIKPYERVEDEKKNKEIYLAKNAKAFDKDADFVRGWHHDSNSFSFILMMSDTKDMIGGETALKTGNGEILKIDNYEKGWASLVQAHCINHIALKPYCSVERITSVTSYRAKDLLHMDPTVITTIKPSIFPRTIYNTFYPEWMDYRLDVMGEKIAWLRRKVAQDRENHRDFNQIEMINYLEDLTTYIRGSWREFEAVDEGHIEQPPLRRYIRNWAHNDRDLSSAIYNFEYEK
ncbi:uncharacterized protein ASCRUDRAFT_74921 [Ascoidea rubescens DSM 1968]|uniref:Fe2OG dioxygenase domain-containing protein n=1 Tax=Ascoidea rubescens DSM 1968 TaxID=1344418 RepID=A0A1D2VLX3_9ASCO|nr:hypothetical protein ASCRUDRAFT_74921 [Ascoidea rubescens DSM 1968]ODV62567.1 hypothetical protein ASCRUDRAFT_74921 [Ascoidea rubescens DSM 1968]